MLGKSTSCAQLFWSIPSGHLRYMGQGSQTSLFSQDPAAQMQRAEPFPVAYLPDAHEVHDTTEPDAGA